jgi:hypothetical protein
MRLQRLLPFALIALAGLTLGSGCPTIPKLKDRVVELAMGGTTTLEFRGQSTVSTTWNSTGTYDLSADIDLTTLLDDADIDASDVTGIKLSGVSYRVSVADAGGHTISNGTVTVQRAGSASASTLVNNFSQNVGSVTPFITAPLTAAGVTVLNDLLADIVTAAKNHTSVANPGITYTIHGTADGLPYDFFWQLKLDISVAGKIKKITVLT